MELRDIRYFAVVAEHLNIGRAAEALDLSATALTKSLRRLEKSVGAKLVQRAAKGVALTAVGTALLARINPLQGTMADVRREAADLSRGEAGHVNAGTNTGTSEIVLAAATSTLCRESPNVTLNVAVATDILLSAAIRKGELDFCISPPALFTPAEFVAEPLYEISNVIIASANHRLAKHKRVSMRDLAGERWVVRRAATFQLVPTHQQLQALTQLFAKHRLPPPVVGLETNSEDVRLSVIAYSDYVGTITRDFLHHVARRYPLVVLPIKETILDRNVCVIYRKNAYLSPAARRLILNSSISRLMRAFDLANQGRQPA